MTTALVAAVLGATIGGGVWALTRGVIDQPALRRGNVRGLDVPTAGGLIMPLALLPLWALVNVHVSMGWDLIGRGLVAAVGTALVVAVVFGFLGLIDDVLAAGDDKGFRGHVGALRRGRLTTGGIKLVGGGVAAVAMAAALSAGQGAWWRVLIDALVIALAANTANLLDRAPGRVTKVAVLVLALLVATGSATDREDLGAAALVVGLALGVLIPELRERVMLGDTGANPLGAVLGLGVVVTCGALVTGVVLAVVVALNLASERISFSAVIARTAPLRWVDELGRTTS